MHVATKSLNAMAFTLSRGFLLISFKEYYILRMVGHAKQEDVSPFLECSEHSTSMRNGGRF